MADGMVINSLKGRVSAEEWQARVDLAALYRLVALHGWDDLIFTHLSHRIPGPEHHFLINPFGLYFDEITASSLVKIDLDGNIIQETPYNVNAAGFTIHSAMHAASEEANVVMHLHTRDGVAVSAQSEGLLPATQHALQVIPDLAYHDYEGIALDHDERERLVADMGDKTMMMLWNHGTLTVGATAAEAFLRMYYLETACSMQVAALSGGREHVRILGDEVRDVVKGQFTKPVVSMVSNHLAWPGLIRKLDRTCPDFRD
ncbi:MAG: class II aldolase/adducin family protein [Pseudomonadota bacterium]